MKTLLAAAAAALALSLTSGPESDPIPEITTRVVKLLEQRVVQMDSDGFQQNPTLTVTVDFQGPELEGVTHWFGLELGKAADDVGTDLRADRFGQTAGGDEAEAIDHDHMWFGVDDPPTDRLRLDIDLGVTPRKARKLARLDGTLTMRRAAMETVSVDGIARLEGKKLQDPRLKKAGVTITVSEVEQGDSVELTIRGELAAVTGFRLLDRAGNDLDAGSSYFSTGGQKTLTLSEDVGRDTTLAFEVVTGSEDFQVPFSIADVELP